MNKFEILSNDLIILRSALKTFKYKLMITKFLVISYFILINFLSYFLLKNYFLYFWHICCVNFSILFIN